MISTKACLAQIEPRPHHVMAGLVPAIYVLAVLQGREDVDARDEGGHDGGEVDAIRTKLALVDKMALSVVQRVRRSLHRRMRKARGWIALIGIWTKRSRERSALMALSDRSLQDIGLTRWDARFEARKPFWRE
ncbi:MAG: DUF1127 domain-containing protein [Xanthobacteraceae bacterium]